MEVAVMMSLVFPLAALLGIAAHTEPTRTLRFDNVRLLVVRFDETFLFYRDVLGLQPTWGAAGENYASFAFPGGGQLALFKRALMADAVGAATQPSTRQEQGTAPIVFSVD